MSSKWLHQAREEIRRTEVHEEAQVHEDDLHVVLFNIATYIPSELLPAVIVLHHSGHVGLHPSRRNAYRTESNISEGYQLWHDLLVLRYQISKPTPVFLRK